MVTSFLFSYCGGARIIQLVCGVLRSSRVLQVFDDISLSILSFKSIGIADGKAYSLPDERNIFSVHKRYIHSVLPTVPKSAYPSRDRIVAIKVPECDFRIFMALEYSK